MNNEKNDDLMSVSIPVPTFIILVFVGMIVTGILVLFIPKLAIIPFCFCGSVLVIYSFFIMFHLLSKDTEKNDDIINEYQGKQDQ